jgi:hypothetical protein
MAPCHKITVVDSLSRPCASKVRDRGSGLDQLRATPSNALYLPSLKSRYGSLGTPTRSREMMDSLMEPSRMHQAGHSLSWFEHLYHCSP